MTEMIRERHGAKQGAESKFSRSRSNRIAAFFSPSLSMHQPKKDLNHFSPKVTVKEYKIPVIQCTASTAMLQEPLLRNKHYKKDSCHYIWQVEGAEDLEPLSYTKSQPGYGGGSVQHSTLSCVSLQSRY